MYMTWILSIFFYLTASWDTAVKTEISNPKLTQVTLVDLNPAKSYNLRTFAINSVGISEASNILTVTTKEAGTFCHSFQESITAKL